MLLRGVCEWDREIRRRQELPLLRTARSKLWRVTSTVWVISGIFTYTTSQ